MSHSRILASTLLLLAPISLALTPSASSQITSRTYSTGTATLIVTSYAKTVASVRSISVTGAYSTNASVLRIDENLGAKVCYAELTIHSDSSTSSFHGSLSSSSSFDFFIFTTEQYARFQQNAAVQPGKCAKYEGDALLAARQVTFYHFDWKPPFPGEYYWIFAGSVAQRLVFHAYKNTVTAAFTRAQLTAYATTIYTTAETFYWVTMNTYTVSRLITMSTPLVAATQSTARTITQRNTPQIVAYLSVFLLLTAALGALIVTMVGVRRRRQ